MRTTLLACVSAFLITIALSLNVHAQCLGTPTTISNQDVTVTFKSVSILNGRAKLTFRVVNGNKNGNFEFVAFQLPDKNAAITPGLATQSVPSETVGNKIMYAVENPTTLPEYAIKYTITSAHGTFKSQGYDEFSYEMSAYEFSQMESLTVSTKHGKITDPVKITFPLRNEGGEALYCQPTSPSFTAIGIDGIDGNANPMSGSTSNYSVTSSNSFVYTWSAPEDWTIVNKTVNPMSAKAGTTAGTMWVMIEEVDAIGQKTGAYIIKTLAVAPYPNPLPVELVNFIGLARSGSVELSWSTATEINNDQFEVERSSNGKDFYKISTVKGAGNSSLLRQYKFLDTAPLAGVAYYRLKQVDFDQAFEYSKVISVKSALSAKSLEPSIYPNPVTENYLTVRLKNYTSTQGPVLFKLTDLNGKIVATQPLDASLQETRVELAGYNLRKGIYLVSVATEEVLHTQRIVIQ
ncbi:T9SS type A sorting domain-containing protein [Nibribacter koreensis]